MSCRGRCAGCAETGPLKAVRVHVVSCPDWAALYQRDPGAALPPDQEYSRWLAEDQPAEKAAAVAARVEQTDDARRVMARRFAACDPLEDDG